MHLSRSVMSSRSHLWLRISAIALLGTLALWPRTKSGASADELAKASRGDRGRGATHGVAARAETTAARLFSGPRTTKLVVAQADETHLTN